MKKYGSKDLMRMESLANKSNGERETEFMHAVNMANAIDLPGKAMARGYAAQEIFGELSPIAYVFFERAFELGGRDVKPEASVNPVDTTEEGIEDFYQNIPIDQQPYSRRENKKLYKGSKKTSISSIIPRGKINLIKGTGPDFSVYDNPYGIIETWKNDENRYRLIYTINNEPNHGIGEDREFKYDNRWVQWTLVDYIEAEYIANLVPLYGKSIPIYNYD